MEKFQRERGGKFYAILSSTGVKVSCQPTDPVWDVNHPSSQCIRADYHLPRSHLQLSWLLAQWSGSECFSSSNHSLLNKGLKVVVLVALLQNLAALLLTATHLFLCPV